MNILITGANGFIGSHLVRRLINDHKIIAIKRASSSLKRLEDLHDQIHWYNGETLPDLEKVFSQEKVDLILHLATKYIKLHTKTEEVKAMSESNIGFPSMLCDLAVKHNVKYFINTGTCFEYQMSNKPISEGTPVGALNYYAASKLAFETILKYYIDTHKLHGLTLKLFYPYGEGDNIKLMQVLFRSLIKNEPLAMTKGEQTLSFTYVNDIVEAYVSAIKYLQSRSAPQYDVFNIGNEQAISVKQIVSLLEKLTGNRNSIKIGEQPYSPNEVMHMQCDAGKARKLLNWSAKFSMEDSLKKMYDFYKLPENV